MVADHHHLRHHSLALEYVEAQAVKVADADVIAHARCFLFQLFSQPPAGNGAGCHPGGIPGGPGGLGR